MKEISILETKNIKAGRGEGLWLCFGAGIVFIIGIFDGMLRPLKCNN